MDNSKHTVTIPISDYNELLAAAKKVKDEDEIGNLHIVAMHKAGIGFPNIEKNRTPQRAMIQNKAVGPPEIFFYYL